MKQSKFIDMEFPVIDYNKEDCHGHSGLAMTDCWAWIQNIKLKKQSQFKVYPGPVQLRSEPALMNSKG